MKTHSRLHSVLLAGLLLMAAGATAAAQTADPEHEAHHPDDAQNIVGTDVPGTAPTAGMPCDMPGMMSMMSPEMMRMMSGMMGGMKQGMRAGTDIQDGMAGPGLFYGMPRGKQEEMTPERVREFLEQRLAWHDNPRLTIGDITVADDGNIIAQIVTVDGSLVQELAFNRYPGLFRQLP